MAKKDLFDSLAKEKCYEKLCLEYLHNQEKKFIRPKPYFGAKIKTSVDNLCCIEGVLLPKIACANAEDNFINLETRKNTLKEIGLSIAERKHTFISVRKETFETPL